MFWTFTITLSLRPEATSKGTLVFSSATSDTLRPMNLLIEKTVLVGLVTAWRFATCPTSRSPSLLKATTEGVVRLPSALGITTGSPPSITATHELVVPRSIPITLLISYLLIENVRSCCDIL